MAKGRRLTSSRSERLLGMGGSFNHNDVVAAAEEYVEEAVWSMVEHSGPHHYHGSSVREWTPRAHTRDRHVGGLSLAFEDKTTPSSRRIVHQFSGGRGNNVAASAPVNVPDWSKIYRVDSIESMHDSDEERVGDSAMEPPHEYLARSRKLHAMSVFEGVGRTLKGRDMSRVRDAVWSQTGFEG